MDLGKWVLVAKMLRTTDLAGTPVMVKASSSQQWENRTHRWLQHKMPRCHANSAVPAAMARSLTAQIWWGGSLTREKLHYPNPGYGLPSGYWQRIWLSILKFETPFLIPVPKDGDSTVSLGNQCLTTPHDQKAPTNLQRNFSLLQLEFIYVLSH